MRSTKDLKDIVSDVRGINRRGNSQAQRISTGAYGTAPHNKIDEGAEETYNFVENAEQYNKERSGGAVYGTKRVESGEAENRLKKLQTLSQSDKETIEQQQKKMGTMRQEFDDLQKKYNTLKRNFDSVSHYAKKDNSEFASVKKRADGFEKEVQLLTQQKQAVEQELAELKQRQKESDIEIKEQKATISTQAKDIEQYKRELARKEK